ncbi:MAG: adenosylcobinamide-GDP ribazoletransferase [Alphaproteobacteria bacterium]|nr:adenosylcobinamide-GDP ribazoletransferase [Alphaproteobacteria bacterium]MBL7098476.1 adenosylcobinamide-GDP ribazoletransferase [Alphaproteobacteria bacterium]
MMLLTRIPTGGAGVGSATFARALWAYPLAGALVGSLGGLTYWGVLAAHLSPLVAAGLAVGVTMLASGALHEDGLADLFDGIGGARDRARRLEIMRDSRIGTYGAAALALSLLLRWSALVALAAPARVLPVWIAAGALSRAAVALPLMLLPPARSDGLGAQAASPPLWSAATAIVIALAIAAALLRLDAAVPATGAFAVAAIVTFIAWRALGGQTGDVLGACALVAEIAALIAGGG